MPAEIGPKCDIKDQAIELNAYQLVSMYEKISFQKTFHQIIRKRSLIIFKNYKFFAVLY
jgi:hypothetical protein